jgi:hypothetical protein
VGFVELIADLYVILGLTSRWDVPSVVTGRSWDHICILTTS